MRRASLKDRKQAAADTPATGTTGRTSDTLLGKERERQEVVELGLREIMPNRFQPRKQLDQEALEELAASIREHGVLQPIVVRPIPLTNYENAGRRYELIAGERRWRASGLAERSTIPTVVREDIDDRGALELSIIENLQRADLHPLDEAGALGRMQKDLGYSYSQIAERLGKSKGYVQNRMRLLSLDADLKQLIAERPDILTHVYELAKVADPTVRASLIIAVRDEGLSFAETKARVEAVLNPAQQPYLRKYDRDEKHKEQVEDLAAPAAAASYLRKYDTSLNDAGESATNSPTLQDSAVVPAPTQGVLTDKERATITAITAKVARLLSRGEQLSMTDRAVLEPLAVHLAEPSKRDTAAP